MISRRTGLIDPDARRAVAFGGALAVVLGLAGVPAHAASLKEAVSTTIAKHPTLQRDVALSRAAERGVDQADSNFLPTIDVDSEAGYEYTNSPTTRSRVTKGPRDSSGVSRFRQDNNFTFRQMAFDGFLASNTVASARATYEGSKDAVAFTGEVLGIRVVQLYIDVLRNQEFVAYAEANVRELGGITDQIRKLAGAGRGTTADVNQAESRLALGRSALEQRRGELRAAVARYVEFVGEEPRDLVNPGVPVYRRPDTEDAAVQQAVANNPSAQVTAASYQAKKFDAKAADAPFYPRLDAELLGSTGSNLDGAKGRDSDFNARMRLRYNAFNGFGDVARRGRANEEANAAQQDDSEQRRQIREDVRVAFRNLATADERIVPLRQHTEASERVLRGYRSQFELGRRSLLDLLDAQNELFQSQLSRTDGEYRIVLANYELVFTMGALLGTVGVPLPADAKPKTGMN
ncbi:MAG: TolC family outer membrane protein [Alphaproteobacteria bacterium]|nr:TolC family outer membrane protein [Alphaproteobacteria bacterium]